MSQSDFIEIERKFLIRELPAGLEDYPSVIIEQTYLSTPGTPPVVRVRRYGGKCLLTIKKRDKDNPMVCGEVEFPIGRNHYLPLKAMGGGHDLEKRRHMIPLGNLTIELDIFGGKLSGLIIAEVEFPSRERADSFEVPEWFGREVTGDIRYSNNSLSVNGLPDG